MAVRLFCAKSKRAMHQFFLKSVAINPDTNVSEIVGADYRTADVFRRYGIEFCCGGSYTLRVACYLQGTDPELLIRDLEVATRQGNTSHTLDFTRWDLDFLMDYIIHVHHQYLYKALPVLQEHVDRFAEGHHRNYPYLEGLQRSVQQITASLLPQLKQEEMVLFPYIRQLAHAHQSRESYAPLLVRTMRKPIASRMGMEHAATEDHIRRWRDWTGGYAVPSNTCVSHRVTLQKLREVDMDMVQHLHLEKNILFPKALAIEKELLDPDY